MLYRRILKPILFRFDPEFVHDRFVSLGEFFGRNAFTRVLVGAIYGYRGSDVSKTVDGLQYRTPVLLSAGFDYNGRLSRILPRVGFGGEEVGSVTARPCEGNPKPRLVRLPKSKSIVVNKGLKNDGVDVIIERLKNATASLIPPLPPRHDEVSHIRCARSTLVAGSTVEAADAITIAAPAGENSPPRGACDETEELLSPRGRGSVESDNFVVGISIARTNDEKSASVQAGIDDYLYSFKRLNEEGVGDYYTVNISCPNAFGGEAFATPELLDQLLSALSSVSCAKPVYVKMPINLAWDKFNALLEIINKHKLQGVVIGNLNKNYNALDFRNEAPADYSGGLSGKPCRELSNELIRKTRQMYSRRFTIIGVGGIMSPEDAVEKFKAGADLIQLITGMIYEGPGLIGKICNRLYGII